MKKLICISTLTSLLFSPFLADASECSLPQRLRLASVEFQISDLSGSYKVHVDLDLNNRVVRCTENAFLEDGNDITKNPIKMTVTNLANGEVTVENYFQTLDIIKREGSGQPYKINLTGGTVLDDRIYINFDHNDDYIIRITDGNNQNIRFGKNQKFNY
ncbi:MAG: hypothetical protein R2827_06290 [Bdellovibrionales bacterium]